MPRAPRGPPDGADRASQTSCTRFWGRPAGAVAVGLSPHQMSGRSRRGARWEGSGSGLESSWWAVAPLRPADLGAQKLPRTQARPAHPMGASGEAGAARSARCSSNCLSIKCTLHCNSIISIIEHPEAGPDPGHAHAVSAFSLLSMRLARCLICLACSVKYYSVLVGREAASSFFRSR